MHTQTHTLVYFMMVAVSAYEGRQEVITFGGPLSYNEKTFMKVRKINWIYYLHV